MATATATQPKIWSHTHFNTPTIAQLEELVKRDTPAMYMVTLTPELAHHIRTQMVGPNRPYRRENELKIMKDLELGNWVWEGSSICFDSRARLMQGQHRCGAIAKTKVSVQTGLIVGLPPEAFDLMDGNTMKRGNPMRLQLKGYKNPYVLSGAAKLLALHEMGGMENVRSGLHPRPTETMVRDVAIKHNKEIQRAIRLTGKLSKLPYRIRVTRRILCGHDASARP